MPHKSIGTVAIIGLGLIGSSLARAIHKARIADTIIGVDESEVSLAFARKGGFIDKGMTDAALAVQNADMVIIATPTGVLERMCKLIAPHIKQAALVMDTGSVKRLPLEIMLKNLPHHAVIVPTHPIAGSEQSGVSAGRGDLFHKKRIIITPQAPLAETELQRVANFWQHFESRVEAMPADMHDRIYGYISHLPQLLAFASSQVVSPSQDELEKSETLSQFVRLYGSDARMWSNIFCMNQDVLLPALDRYLSVVSHIRGELANAPKEASAAPAAADPIARTSLFPRLVASCLITTIMEAEKNAGLSFARFAGTGFADYTAPANAPPEEDMEHISSHYRAVVPLLDRFCEQLVAIRGIIATNDEHLLSEALK